MPCNTDYMEPTVQERQRVEAAKLALFVSRVMDVPAPFGTRKSANHIYGEGADPDSVVRWLCTQMKKEKTPSQIRAFTDITNPDARKLAEWWEEHQREDARREDAERRKNVEDKLSTVWVIWDQTGKYYTSMVGFGETEIMAVAKGVNGCYTEVGADDVRWPK